MPQPVWGILEKAQDDSQKIGAAISAAIAAHEADPTSHLGENESLQSHKASIIIDHAAHSVVRDKLEFDRFQIDTAFESLDGWSLVNSVTQLGIGDMKLLTGANPDDYAEATLAIGSGIIGQAKLSQNPLLQIRLKSDFDDDQSIFIGNFNRSTPAGFGFVVYDNEVCIIWTDDGGGINDEQVAGIAANEWHTYEMQVENGTDIKWYIDGVFKKTMLNAEITEADRIASIRITAGEDGARSVHVTQVHFDADLLNA